MTFNSMRLIRVSAALLLAACVATDASAQCCGGYSAYYPSAYSAYSPVAYQANYGGWYPGYWMDRVSARLWGSPSGYVTGYPSTYASYRPAYAVSYGGYATSYLPPSSCSSCSSYTSGYSPCSTCAGYAPCSSCSSYSPCSSCGTYSSSYAPSCGTYGTSYAPSTICGSSCQSCSGCSSCSGQAVTQASYQSYQQPAGCGNCAANAPMQGAAVVTGPPVGVAQPAPAPGAAIMQQQPAPTQTEPRPSLDSGQQGTGESTFRFPPDNGQQQQVQPEPGSENNNSDPYKVNNGNNATYLEAPKLFNPKDRTAQRSIAPVHTALYQQPVSYHEVSTARGPLTAKQAQQDAAGWTSASH